MNEDINNYKEAIHQMINKINDISVLKRIYHLVFYLYAKKPG